MKTDSIMRSIELDHLRRKLMYVGYDDLGLVNLKPLRMEIALKLEQIYAAERARRGEPHE